MVLSLFNESVLRMGAVKKVLPAFVFFLTYSEIFCGPVSVIPAYKIWYEKV